MAYRPLNHQHKRWLCLLAALPALGLFLSFLQDLLVISPVLDSRENLNWALRIARGDLPNEPFYRALGYPLFLSFFSFADWALPQIAALLGMSLHLLNAWMTSKISRKLWESERAAWLAGFLYACYPVAMYFSMQMFDITLGISCFLMGFNLILSTGSTHKKFSWRYGLGGGLLLGVSVLVRPNFLPAVLLAPLYPCFAKKMAGAPGRHGVRVSGSIMLGIVWMLAVQGALNFKISGQLRIMPWQGAYNLYAANQPGANGKYFVQTISFDEIPEGENPTRMESEYLYQQIHGVDAPLDIDEMGAYWRTRLVEEIKDNPGSWVRLMGRKVLYVFNHYEQYNNLSYEYQRQRFFLLRWNPLGWGVVLLASVLAVLLAFPKMHQPTFRFLVLLMSAYAAGLLLFFVSARFRLPLTPLLCAMAGGLAEVRLSDRTTLSKRYLMGTFLVFCLLAGLIFGNWADARNPRSFIQDEYLLASAALRIGEDHAAIRYAADAVKRDENDPEIDRARHIAISAHYNIAVFELGADDPRSRDHWIAIETELSKIHSPNHGSKFIEGVIAWRQENHFHAVEIWKDAVTQFGDRAGRSAKALQVVNAVDFDFPENDPEIQFLSILLL